MGQTRGGTIAWKFELNTEKEKGGWKEMSVFVGETYVVKPDKVAENAALLQKLAKLMKEKPAAFKGLKSYKAYSETFGTWGSFTEVWEFESYSEFQNMFAKFMQDPELMKIPQDFLS